MITRRASKHRMATDESDGSASGKKAHLSDSARLMEAVESGNIGTATGLLENKAVKLSKSSLQAALLKAVNEGKKRMVQLVLNHGVDVSGKNKLGGEALVSAAEHGYLDIVKLLIKKGVSVDGRNASGKTALMMAVEKSCCLELTTYLLNECQADQNLQDNAGKTALMLAVELWDYETVQVLLRCVKSVPNVKIKDKSGNSLHDMAMRNGSAELMDVLLLSKEKGVSALLLAVMDNNSGLVRLLLELDPSCVNRFREDEEETPLAAAMAGLELNYPDDWDGKIHCSTEMMDLLLQAEVDVDAAHFCGFTPLIFAASASFEAGVRMLIWHGADVNDYNMEHQTALMEAAQKGHANIVDLLLEAGACPDKVDLRQESALTLAVENGHKLCTKSLLKCVNQLTLHDVELLEENGMLHLLKDISDRWEQLFEPVVLGKVLCMAIKATSYQLVVSLLDYGVDVNACYNSSYPLFLAVEDVNMLRLVLDKGADINICSQSTGYTALMQAAFKGDRSQVELLMHHNADLYVESRGFTALTLACLNQRLPVIQALLEGGVDVNHVTGTGQTALFCLLSVKNFAATEMLVKHGADVNFKDPSGTTALMQAIKLCTSNFAELLIKHGAEVNAQDRNCETALFHALRHSITREDKVALLLQHGADVNHVNLLTVTPLMVAARFCNTNILELLLSYDSYVNAQDSELNTALHFAVKYSASEEKLTLLVNLGANVNASNSSYEVPLMIAVNNLKKESVESLINLGASVNSHSSSFVTQLWRSDIDRMIQRCSSAGPDSDNFTRRIKCLEILLENGFCLQDLRSSNLDLFLCTCINADARKMIQLLLQSGVGPSLLDLSSLPAFFPLSYIIDAVSICSSNASPLCTAILFHRPEIVAFFAQACFYHQKDVKMLQQPAIRIRLEEMFQHWPHKSLSPLEELSPKNWSLHTWSKLTISRAVGFSGNRAKKVKTLRLPQGLQDELLFQNIEFPGGCPQEFSSGRSSVSGLGLDFTD